MWVGDSKTVIVSRVPLHICRGRHVTIDAIASTFARLVMSVAGRIDFGRGPNGRRMASQAQRIALGPRLARMRFMAINGSARPLNACGCREKV